MAELHMPHDNDRRDESPAVHHEISDANVRGVFAFAGGLTLVSAFVAFVVWVLFQYLSAREARVGVVQYPLAAQATRVPPEPRLQTHPRQDLNDLRAGEDQTLASYGWVDRNAGIVRIPIERAMQLAVERGLPTRPADEQKR